ncbi:hypothetical protein C2S51_019398 [Perilla frutescens var. frutescens]|nr:hypothetical protein C2S51_019398 [Perilla frutescens var. frutescens]
MINSVQKNGEKTPQKLEFTHNNLYSEVQFRPDHNQESMRSGEDSGVASPPLWKNSPSPARSPSRPLLSHYSPDSRAQAIARGRSELMEMVRRMPESSYELSLKDIVEHHHGAENQAPKTGDGSQQRGVVKVMKKEESKRFDRNLSFENKGLFLNMVFPFSFKSKKKKKIVGNNSGRVSPKPEGLKSGGERDWWKKKFTGSSDSDSSKISTSSGSTGSSGATASTASADARGRKRGGFRTGCWHFFHSRRSKSAE